MVTFGTVASILDQETQLRNVHPYRQRSKLMWSIKKSNIAEIAFNEHRVSYGIGQKPRYEQRRADRYPTPPYQVRRAIDDEVEVSNWNPTSLQRRHSQLS